MRASPDGWISLFCLSFTTNRTDNAEAGAFLRIGFNTLYTYRVFGQASFEIVAATNDEALEACRRFRLPCFNASKYIHDAQTYNSIGWAKIKLARDVLKMGYNVHISDLDVSYLKPVQPAIKEVFSWTMGAADGSMMHEEWVYQDDPKIAATRRPIYLGNLGVVFLRANERSIRFLESMLTYAVNKLQDQHAATLVSYQSWAPCVEEASCLAVRARGMAAITLTPSQFPAWNCQPEPDFDICGWRRLYVHAVCRATSRDKEGFLRYLRLMFIRPGGEGNGTDTAPPAAGGATGDRNSSSNSGGSGGRGLAYPSVVGQQDNAALAASGLPCPEARRVAWRQEPSVTTPGEGEGRGGCRTKRLQGRA